MFSSKNLIAHAKNNLKGNYLKYFIVMILTFMFSSIQNVFGLIDMNIYVSLLLTIILSLIISTFITIYILNFDLNIAKGKDNIFPDISEIFSKFFKCLGLSIILVISVYGGLLLLIVPGVCAMIYFSQAIYILMEDDDKSVIDCLKESVQLMKGNVWNCILLDINLIPYILLSIITLGVYLIWAIPIIQVSSANFYLYLKESKEGHL